ncbi:methionyl-tRNA formyltransferase [Thermomicrobium sp. 4228-Ro]|uniref:methionyl-tRNA formyltransferase n=1 Tax=Thermomicrobium sp. 4228-Ro TaxID=2993937 RepID=UPI00224917EE|nr:methionyl-tRNA formyltransferase [Thermomicrobium sp. 4228-Ro]MCX2726094.1 methionyl-tRNA formyltransferase [Thermomicrobium sp. 4228-Ro]
MSQQYPAPLRIVFFGTPAFAVPSLERLASEPDLDVALVVTQPDRPAGRGRERRPSPVKQRAIALGLSVLQPETVRDPLLLSRLRDIAPAVGVVVAYGELIPKSLLDVPAHGFLNVHPSLLPKYRGASPIQAAILNGDSETGVTVIQLTPELDAGPIVRQVRVAIYPDDTAATLAERLAAVAAELLPETIRQWVAGTIVPTPQDERLASYTRPLTKEDGRIDWTRTAREIERHIRAMQPWPGAWTTISGRLLRIVRARVVDTDVGLPPGCLWPTRDALLVATGQRALALELVQPEGKRVMPGLDWWRGARLEAGSCFDA